MKQVTWIKENALTVSQRQLMIVVAMTLSLRNFAGMIIFVIIMLFIVFFVFD